MQSARKKLQPRPIAPTCAEKHPLGSRGIAVYSTAAVAAAAGDAFAKRHPERLVQSQVGIGHQAQHDLATGRAAARGLKRRKYKHYARTVLLTCGGDDDRRWMEQS